jgi:hypothetical protein
MGKPFWKSTQGVILAIAGIVGALGALATAINNLSIWHPTGSVISVVNASYGKNCVGQAAGNATADVKLRCDGKTRCDYPISTATFGDPAFGCPKDFDVTFRCSGDGGAQVDHVPGESSGSTAALACDQPHT